MLEKTYRPDEVESRHYARWEESGAFACDLTRTPDVGPDAEPYTIVIPPPNVTGRLHIGHALNTTLQDILIRYARMRGKDALWQPGTDHAGIATQMVVERQLGEEGKSRHDLGRDGFIDRVWQWKEESGGAILGQLRRLGASCDWERERFTMDDGLSDAVRTVFVTLYNEGLIYRDKRLVNWDPKLHTAISDLEVEQIEQTGSLWHFCYPLEDAPDKFITVATTRPETMLGDTAVAVHPEDERFADLIGKNVMLPFAARPIPIVADAYADPEKGSGAVKITPAHDFNDFEVGRRHGLEMINIFDADARLNENAPAPYSGMDRFEARKRIVADMDALGLLDRVEENPMTVPYGDRSGVVIEPWLTDQWYVNAEELAGPAIKSVEEGRTKFVPAHWENTYFEWMRNIQPWCISRQLWWGHQIPAWFGPDGEIFVAMSEEEALAAADAHYGKRTPLERETDVLDTWFSSALWPFSTLGWPEKTPELAHYYPTNTLVTAFDIIFFWVARMMMMGLHFLEKEPFETVYIHALVRDEHGQKMSKSKGNAMDPIELADQYGADAVRFTLAALAAQGRDIRLSPERIEGYRNFITKLWNAARYAKINGCEPVAGFDPAGVSETVNRWIIGALGDAAAKVEKGIEEYRFNDAAGALYQFAWHTFCDWYLEFTKPVLAGDDEAAIAETRAVTAWVLDQILHLMHPFAPFVTEELWEKLGTDGEARPSMLISAAWPVINLPAGADDASLEMEWVVALVSEIRAVRSQMNVPAGAEITIQIKDAAGGTERRLAIHRGLIMHLARLEELELVDDVPTEGAVQTIVQEATVIMPLAGVIDIAAETSRLQGEIDKAQSEIDKFAKKLANRQFTERAPADVVAENRTRLEDAESARDKLTAAQSRLKSL